MIRIITVKPDEILEVKRLLSYTWTDTYGKLYSKKAIKKITATWHSAKNLAAQPMNPDFYFGAAKDETNKIVGITTVRKTGKETIVMQRLYVHPKYQRQGIGGQLMDRAVSHFNAKKIRLEVEEKNKMKIIYSDPKYRYPFSSPSASRFF